MDAASPEDDSYFRVQEKERRALRCLLAAVCVENYGHRRLPIVPGLLAKLSVMTCHSEYKLLSVCLFLGARSRMLMIKMKMPRCQWQRSTMAL